MISLIREGPDKSVGECAALLGVNRKTVRKAILLSDPFTGVGADSGTLLADRR
jgi:hypothetical protein